jgi:hypothetical protein
VLHPARLRVAAYPSGTGALDASDGVRQDAMVDGFLSEVHLGVGVGKWAGLVLVGPAQVASELRFVQRPAVRQGAEAAPCKRVSARFAERSSGAAVRLVLHWLLELPVVAAQSQAAELERPEPSARLALQVAL